MTHFPSASFFKYFTTCFPVSLLLLSCFANIEGESLKRFKLFFLFRFVSIIIPVFKLINGQGYSSQSLSSFTSSLCYSCKFDSPSTWYDVGTVCLSFLTLANSIHEEHEAPWVWLAIDISSSPRKNSIPSPSPTQVVFCESFQEVPPEITHVEQMSKLPWIRSIGEL